MGKLGQKTKQTGWAICCQIQKLTSWEITSRPQLHFGFRPRKAAKPGGQCQNQVQWLTTSWPGSDQSVGTSTLKGHTWKTWWILWSPLRQPPTTQPLKALKTLDPVLTLSPRSMPVPFPSLSFPPQEHISHFLSSRGPHKACNLGSNE